jgi:hypothetical protein
MKVIFWKVRCLPTLLQVFGYPWWTKSPGKNKTSWHFGRKLGNLAPFLLAHSGLVC